MAKPQARSFTLAEKRALLFEQVSLYMVFLVALIAAAISFVALRAVGGEAGLGGASFLLPIAIDGFGIACSVGIVRSVAQGEGLRGRVSEWLGLFVSLGLSILGNVQHALTVGAPTLPDYVKIAYATAIPVIVAYGIHVYGRAMSKGISAHVLADNPDELVFGIAHLGDDTVAARRAPARIARTRTAQPAAQAPAQPARTVETPAAQPARAPEAPARTAQPAPAARMDPEQDRARQVFDQLLAADPFTKPDAAQVHREAEVSRNVATSRRWVQKWWDEHEAAMGTGSDPIADQVAADEKTATADSSAA